MNDCSRHIFFRILGFFGYRRYNVETEVRIEYQCCSKDDAQRSSIRICSAQKWLIVRKIEEDY